MLKPKAECLKAGKIYTSKMTTECLKAGKIYMSKMPKLKAECLKAGDENCIMLQNFILNLLTPKSDYANLMVTVRFFSSCTLNT